MSLFGRSHRLDNEQLQALIETAKSRMRVRVRQLVASAEVWHMGSVHIDPQYLAFQVILPTDAELQRVEAVPGLAEELRALLAGTGYPAEAVPLVGFGFASQETCDRDFKGNWYYYFK